MLRKGIVIGNCQSYPVANALNMNCLDTHFECFGVHVLPADNIDGSLADLVQRGQSELDVIISIPLSEEWGPISASRIRETFSGKPVIMISNIFFSGWHPDLTYIGGLNQRVGGPLGDYHSCLALFGFVQNLTPSETLALFNNDVYQSAGYYDFYSSSLKELQRRDSEVDVRVTDILEEAMHQELCFFSVNHPTSALLAPFARLIMRHLASLGICRPSEISASNFLYENCLIRSSVFPVYPEIAARHGMPGIGSYVFKPDGGTINSIDLPQFIEGEFAAFQEVGRDVMAATPTAQEQVRRFSFLL